MTEKVRKNMNVKIVKEQTCCFIGHRKIKRTTELKINLSKNIERLITEKRVDTFLFGSKSQFDDLCLEVVTELKEKYPQIKRIYVRAEFPYIDDDYRNHLLQYYEDTYYPEKIIDAGKAVYVERNYEMIDNSNSCIFYFDECYEPARRKNSKKDLLDYQPKSGTRIAYEYAEMQKKEFLNVYS